jgi:hypothetical protein
MTALESGWHFGDIFAVFSKLLTIILSWLLTARSINKKVHKIVVSILVLKDTQLGNNVGEIIVECFLNVVSDYNLFSSALTVKPTQLGIDIEFYKQIISLTEITLVK